MIDADVERDDRGLTLVELLVTVAVGAIVLGLVAVTFVNGVTAQRNGVARDSATGAANVVASTLAVSIRNSTAIRVNGAGTRLDAVYIDESGTPECRAWELFAGELVYRADTSGELPAADSSWGKLAEGVHGTLGADAVFAAIGVKSVQIGMEITMDQITVGVTDGATAQAVGGGGLTCWH